MDGRDETLMAHIYKQTYMHSTKPSGIEVTKQTYYILILELIPFKTINVSA